MDDAFGYLIGAIIAVFIIYWIIRVVAWLIVHVVPWLLIIAVPAFLLGLLLRSGRIKLTWRGAAAVLLGCSAVAWLITFGLVSSLYLPEALIFSIGPALFYTLSLLLLVSWAVGKVLLSGSCARAAHVESKAAAKRVLDIEQSVQRLQRRLREIGEESGEDIEALSHLTQEIDRLYSFEPRTLGLLAQDLESRVGEFSRERLSTALADLSQRAGSLGTEMERMILQREVARRVAGQSPEQLSRYRGWLCRAEEDLRCASTTSRQLSARAGHLRERHRAQRNGPIFL